MTEARQRADWWHTAALLAAVRNLFAKKGDAVSVSDCHPMERRSSQKLETVSVSILRDIFCRK